MIKYIFGWFNLPNTLLTICNKLDGLYEKLVEIQQLVQEEYTYEPEVEPEPEPEPEPDNDEKDYLKLQAGEEQPGYIG